MKNILVVFVCIYFSALIAGCKSEDNIVNNPTAIDENRWIKSGTVFYGDVSSMIINGPDIYAGISTSNPNNGGIYITTNNSTSWTKAIFYDISVYSLAVSANYLFAGTSQGLYRSSNSGNNWNLTSLNKVTRALAINGTTVYAGTDYGVYYSSFTGSSWNKYSLSSDKVNCVAVNQNNVYFGTDDFIWFTLNNGTGWFGHGFLKCNSITTNGNSVFVGKNYGSVNIKGSIYKTSNNGLNWSTTNLDSNDVLSLTTFGDNIFAGTNRGGVYHSPNNGINWKKINEGFDANAIPQITSLIIGNGYIFAGTAGQTVFRRSLNGLVQYF